MLLLPLMAWWRRARPVVHPGLWLFALGLPLGVNEALLKPLFPEAHTLVNDWYTFNHYLLLTLYGFALASMQGAWDWLAARRFWSLGAGVVILVALLTLFETGILAHDSVADSLAANVFTWTWLLAFLGLGRQYMSYSNPLLKWARDASYPVYILHQTVIIVGAYFVVQQPWDPWTKYWLVLLTTMLVCALLYEMIRRVAVARFLFGMKPQQPRDATIRKEASSISSACATRASPPEPRGSAPPRAPHSAP
jgi:membrane-bound acyltransferase YfiQ involved in biofilm formation